MGFLSSLMEQDVGRALANLGNLDQCVTSVSIKYQRNLEIRKRKSQRKRSILVT